MQLLLSLLPEPDTITMLVEESMPWFKAYFVVLVMVIAGLMVAAVISRVREQKRSPVEKLVKRRGFGV